jgi:hypothetical protein
VHFQHVDHFDERVFNCTAPVRRALRIQTVDALTEIG